jgi:hypothetical protein
LSCLTKDTRLTANLPRAKEATTSSHRRPNNLLTEPRRLTVSITSSLHPSKDMDSRLLLRASPTARRHNSTEPLRRGRPRASTRSSHHMARHLHKPGTAHHRRSPVMVPRRPKATARHLRHPTAPRPHNPDTAHPLHSPTASNPRRNNNMEPTLPQRRITPRRLPRSATALPRSYSGTPTRMRTPCGLR